jgi:L-fucose isomerase-like protein
MHVVCQNGFEHHAAMNRSHSAAVVSEALGRYMGWQIYHHERPRGLPALP